MRCHLALGTSSRRRPGPTTIIRALKVRGKENYCGPIVLAAKANLLTPVVGPGLRRDDGDCGNRRRDAEAAY